MVRDVKMFIDGEWVDASEKGTFDSLNPADNSVIAKVPAGTREDADRAVAAARTAFESKEWRYMDPSERGRILFKAAALVRERMNEIVETEVLDNGKTVREARGDINFAAWTMEYYAGLADKVQGDTIPTPGPRFTYTVREPLGVTAHIVPWNFPFQLAVRGIAPALAAGNTVVAKPASWTSLSLLKLAEVFEAAGLPKGVFNVVTGSGSVVGDALAKHKDVDSITLTGSGPTGTSVAVEAAKNFTPVTLELGGKSPNIVFPDADLERAVKGAFYGIFMNAGQMCWAGSRLLVHEDVHDEVVQRLTKMAEGWALGNGLEKDTRMGPLVSTSHMESVLTYIETAKGEGATLVTGGERATDGDLGKGNFVKPTIFTDVKPGTALFREEVFGPVLAVTRFSDDKEALALANDTEFGLYAGVWTSDLKRAHKMIAGIEAGAVSINEYPVTFPQAPFTGWKASGIGSEQGMDAIAHYTRTKTAFINLG